MDKISLDRIGQILEQTGKELRRENITQEEIDQKLFVIRLMVEALQTNYTK